MTATVKSCTRCGEPVVTQDGLGNLRTLDHACPALKTVAPKAEPWIEIRSDGTARVVIPGSLWNYYEPADRVTPSTPIDVWVERKPDGEWVLAMPADVPDALCRIVEEAVQRDAEKRKGEEVRAVLADVAEGAWTERYHATGLWRCEGCGDAYDAESEMSRWRWTGEAYEHKCPGLHSQAGHMPARWFGEGPAVAQGDGDGGAQEG
jgi:hypothetical protein